MTLRLVSLATLMLCATASLACDDRASYTFTNQSGVKTGLFLSLDNFLASPAWEPAYGSPPLGVAAAIATALDWAKRENQKYDDVNFSGLSIESYSCGNSPTYWYYMIDYTPTFDGNEVHAARSWVAVLLDGSVVGPEIVQD